MTKKELVDQLAELRSDFRRLLGDAESLASNLRDLDYDILRHLPFNEKEIKEEEEEDD